MKKQPKTNKRYVPGMGGGSGSGGSKLKGAGIQAVPLHDRLVEYKDSAIENVVHDNHKRAKNWVAKVTPNRMAPGGYDRDFLRKNNRYVDASSVKAGDNLEFGGDYYSGGGNKRPNRRYYTSKGVKAGYMGLNKMKRENEKK